MHSGSIVQTEPAFLALWNGAIDDAISTLFKSSTSITGVTAASSLPLISSSKRLSSTSIYFPSANEVLLNNSTAAFRGNRIKRLKQYSSSSSKFEDFKSNNSEFSNSKFKAPESLELVQPSSKEVELSQSNLSHSSPSPSNSQTRELRQNSNYETIHDLIDHLRNTSGWITLDRIVHAAYGFPYDHSTFEMATNRLTQLRQAAEFNRTLDLLASWNDPVWDAGKRPLMMNEERSTADKKRADDERVDTRIVYDERADNRMLSVSDILGDLENTKSNSDMMHDGNGEETDSSRNINPGFNRNLNDQENSQQQMSSDRHFELNAKSLAPVLHYLNRMSLQVGTPLYEALQLFPNPLSEFNISDVQSKIQEHLVCFLPGTMALSVMSQWEKMTQSEKMSQLDSTSDDDQNSQIVDPSSVNLSDSLIRMIKQIEINPALLETEEWMHRFRLLSQMELAKSVLDSCLLGYLKSPMRE